MHCFILNGKELPIHWLTTVSIFCDIFVMLIQQSLNDLHFRRGHIVIEIPVNNKENVCQEAHI